MAGPTKQKRTPSKRSPAAQLGGPLADLERWRGAAAALPAEAIKGRGVSVSVAIAEAEAAARYAQEVWQPKQGQPGLVEASALLGGEAIIDELASLARAARYLELERRAPRRPDLAAQARLDRARTLLRDLDAGCAAVIEVEHQSKLATSLDEARRRRGQRPGRARLAQGLLDVAAIGGQLRRGLASLGLDLAILDEARTLGQALSDAPDHRPAAARVALRKLRDRLLWLAEERLRRLATIASFVFRDHPALRRAGRRSSWRR